MTERRREVRGRGGRPALRRGAAAALLLAGTGLAFAQAPAEEMPRIEFEAAASVRRAEALLERARAVNLVDVTVSGARTTRDEEIAFDGTVAQPRTQTVITATASIPVLAASDWAAAAESRDQVRVSKLAQSEVRQQVAVATAQTYLAILAARRQTAVEQDALDNARSHLDYARKRLGGGAGSRLDEVRAALQVSAEELRLENARLALFDSQAALGVLLAEDGPIDAGAEPDLEVPAPTEAPTWRADRPDLRLRAASLDAAERALRDSKRHWLPNASLAFTPQWVTPAGIFQRSNSWQLSLLFSQPLFDSGARGSETAERSVARDQAKLALSAAEIQARSEVEVARRTLDSRKRVLETARRAAAQATEVLKITTSAFELGAKTNLEVIDAERSSRDAATSAALAEDGVRRAQLDLLVALGRFPAEPTPE
jgi:outer membrane protein